MDGPLADAKYVIQEIVRGEVLPGPELEKAQPLIAAMLTAIETCETAPGVGATAALQTAMAALMAMLSPVTLQSLKDTQLADGAAGGFVSRLVSRFRGDAAPPAFGFSTRFASFTVFAAILVVVFTFANDNKVARLYGERLHMFATLLLPYLYGTVGSCVFLLRSLHKHIYGRTFDRRRRPEYLNRVLLGTVSGGIIGLFVGAGSSDASTSAKIDSDALGFLAGYNIDLLFSSLERVTGAIFPKPAPVTPPDAPVPGAAKPAVTPETMGMVVTD